MTTGGGQRSGSRSGRAGRSGRGSTRSARDLFDRRPATDDGEERSAEPAAGIPPPASKAKRSRQWEQEHNDAVVTYRGIPRELHASVKRVAERDLFVKVGEVARAFLDHALAAYQSGQLKLETKLVAGKVTLTGISAERKAAIRIIEDAAETAAQGPSLPPAASKAKRNRQWERDHNATAATYRGIPRDLQASLRHIAEDELYVNVGEVARAFLEFALAAYTSGELTLETKPLAGKSTLYSEQPE